ncbi:DNA cytosine methyltransferase [Kerstersia gyiorum]|nr:DNA cytosine methyltransferase [Kerstersia gyiorum]
MDAVDSTCRSQGKTDAFGGGATDSTGKLTSLDIVVRANRKIALGQDVKAAHHYLESSRHPAELKHRLTADKKTLNVIELFAGAGGMGLGFLNARSPDGRGYRIVGSAEIHPIYTQTLRRNHAFMEKEGLTPVGATPAEYAPMDLCSDKTRARLGAMAKARGSIDVMIGGRRAKAFLVRIEIVGRVLTPTTDWSMLFCSACRKWHPRCCLWRTFRGYSGPLGMKLNLTLVLLPMC